MSARTDPGVRTALFLLPTDRMGGAENVLRLTALAAAADPSFDHVAIFVLAGAPSGSLSALAGLPNVSVRHSGARSEKSGLPALARVLAERRYELVFSSHTHLNAAASAARTVGLLRTERLVARESTMMFERELGRIGPLIRSLYKLYGAQDRIVCQSERMAVSLARHTGARLHGITRHIPNPVVYDGDRTVQSEADRERSIVWCGRLAPVKSPERALQTLALLPEHRLTMVGDGPMRADLEALAASLEVTDRVVFTGRVPAPTHIMRRSALGLMTSDIEGFPNVILEMLASGVERVVTTDCAGGLSEIPGVAVTSADPAALAACLAAPIEPSETFGIDDYLTGRTPDAFLRALVAA